MNIKHFMMTTVAGIALAGALNATSPAYADQTKAQSAWQANNVQGQNQALPGSGGEAAPGLDDRRGALEGQLGGLSVDEMMALDELRRHGDLRESMGVDTALGAFGDEGRDGFDRPVAEKMTGSGERRGGPEDLLEGPHTGSDAALNEGEKQGSSGGRRGRLGSVMDGGAYGERTSVDRHENGSSTWIRHARDSSGFTSRGVDHHADGSRTVWRNSMNNDDTWSYAEHRYDSDGNLVQEAYSEKGEDGVVRTRRINHEQGTDTTSERTADGWTIETPTDGSSNSGNTDGSDSSSGSGSSAEDESDGNGGSGTSGSSGSDSGSSDDSGNDDSDSDESADSSDSDDGSSDSDSDDGSSDSDSDEDSADSDGGEDGEDSESAEQPRPGGCGGPTASPDSEGCGLHEEALRELVPWLFARDRAKERREREAKLKRHYTSQPNPEGYPTGAPDPFDTEDDDEPTLMEKVGQPGPDGEWGDVTGHGPRFMPEATTDPIPEM